LGDGGIQSAQGESGHAASDGEWVIEGKP
jgi:hypothetical protein